MKLKCFFTAIFVSLVVAGAVLSGEAMLPENLIIDKEFKPGEGEPVGKVLLVKGQTVIMHAGGNRGYRAKKDMPLYNGDIIVTLKDGRISFAMNDGSVVTLASGTKLVIRASALDRQNKTHSMFLGMDLGKVRFNVRKPDSQGRTDFRVRTGTALIKVGGSDFLVESTKKSTSVTAFEDTQLEIMSLSKSCGDHWDFDKLSECGGTMTELSEFERIVIDAGAQVMQPEKLTPEQIEHLRDIDTDTAAIEETPPKTADRAETPVGEEDVRDRQEVLAEEKRVPAEVKSGDLPTPPGVPE